MDGYYVWCGAVIRVGQTYHMFASRWPVATGFPGGYMTHSEIVRATAARAEGPYTFQEVIVGKRASAMWDSGMAHNPAIYCVGDTFVLYYNACEEGSTYRQIGVATAPAVTGPWTRRNTPLDLGLQTDANNPSAFFEPDGSVKLVWRDRELRPMISTAESFEGPYQVVNDNIYPPSRLEDFFLFKQGGRYLILVEDNRSEITGHERWGGIISSPDGIHDWQKDAEPVGYDHEIRYCDGSVLRVTRRERPWLLIEEEGASYLFTSVYDGVSTWNQPVPIDPPYPVD
jgi:hypothetical protein